jgi:hypothetical protein
MGRSLRELKFACLNSPGNATFWEEIKGLGLRGGLISEAEALQYSGISDVSQEEAEEASVESPSILASR